MIELKSAVDICLGNADEYKWVFCCPDISHRQLQEDKDSKKKDKKDSEKKEKTTTESPFVVTACKSGTDTYTRTRITSHTPSLMHISQQVSFHLLWKRVSTTDWSAPYSGHQ